MADEIKSSKRDEVFRRLEQRRDERSQLRAAYQAEKETNEAEHTGLLEELDSMVKAMANDVLKAGDKGLTPGKDFMEITETLDALNNQMQRLDQHFKEKSTQMAKYDVERMQKAVSEVRSDYLQLQDTLQPKKKFGFKSKSKTSTAPKQIVEKKAVNIATKDDDTSSNHLAKDEDTSYHVTNPEGRPEVVVPSGDVLERDVSVDNLVDCVIKIFGVPSTVHVTNMTNVTFLCGPVQTSVFIENCRNCTFVLACQQLRTHSTTDSKFYLKVTSKGIIEDCKAVQFAPFALDYPDLDAHMTKSGLDRNVNNWDKIDDFNWLYSGKQSPNWSILPLENRQLKWS